MKPSSHKQKGFVIISMMIVFGFLSLAAMEWGKIQAQRKVQANTESFYNHVVYLRTQIQAYSTRKIQKGVGINKSDIFPSQLVSLVPDFLPHCTPTNNRLGRCRMYNQTPWGTINPLDYRVVAVGGTPTKPDFYRAELDIKLPPASDTAYQAERAATLSLFSMMPSVTFDEARNLITLRIDRPDKAFAYDGLVKRSGDDSTLRGDWDLGGLFGLTNAKDVTLKAKDGSQIAMSSKLSESTAVSHGGWVEKPKCIAGQLPKARLSIASVDVDTRSYSLLGGLKAYVMRETGTHWQVGISISAKVNSSGRETILTSGEALLTASCR